MFELRNRSALAVNCCVIIHCLDVSCKEDQITSAQRFSHNEAQIRRSTTYPHSLISAFVVHSLESRPHRPTSFHTRVPTRVANLLFTSYPGNSGMK